MLDEKRFLLFYTFEEMILTLKSSVSTLECKTLFSLVSTEGSWLKLTLKEKYDYYYNVDSQESSWVTPESCLRKESWLMGEEIEVGVGV